MGGGGGRGKRAPNFSIIYFNVKRQGKGLQSCKENKNVCQEYFKWLILLNFKYNRNSEYTHKLLLEKQMI